MVKGASFSAGFSTPSTSSPIRVSVPTISSTVAFVSRWSFSHERVNFMRPLPPTALAHPARKSRNASASADRRRRRRANRSFHISASPDGRSRSRRQRSEEHTSELQSLMRISYAVFCLKKKKKTQKIKRNNTTTQSKYDTTQ